MQNNNKKNKNDYKKVGRFAAIRNWLKQSKWKKKDKITNSHNINNIECEKANSSIINLGNGSIISSGNNTADVLISPNSSIISNNKINDLSYNNNNNNNSKDNFINCFACLYFKILQYFLF